MCFQSVYHVFHFWRTLNDIPILPDEAPRLPLVSDSKYHQLRPEHNYYALLLEDRLVKMLVCDEATLYSPKEDNSGESEEDCNSPPVKFSTQDLFKRI